MQWQFYGYHYLSRISSYTTPRACLFLYPKSQFSSKINLGTLAFFLLSPLLIFPFSSIGHCSDFHTRQPPRGLQFTLGTPRDPAMFDTIVMANLVRPTELCWLKLGFSPLFAGKRIVSLLN